jgi:tetratricopeptide (TPR) repeat protein
LRKVADLQVERGEVTHALATLHSLLELEHDKRLPSSLGPVVWFHWIPLARLQAETGDSSAAAQSLKAYMRDAGEAVALLATNNPRRQLLANPEQLLGSALQLIEGDSQSALNNATSALNRIEPIQIPAGDMNSFVARLNVSNGALNTASRAAVRLGRYAQAETLARRWLAIPADPTTERDPQIDASSARATLAHALAMQGRKDEARTILQPALDYYGKEQQAGAHGTQFRHDYGYALYVSALAFNSDSDQPKREAALNDASALISGASDEARNLADMRYVADLIAAARASQHG